MEVRCQVVEQFNTAECILQGSVNFSVYHNLSLILITSLTSFNTPNAVQWHQKCSFKPDPIVIRELYRQVSCLEANPVYSLFSPHMSQNPVVELMV